MHMFPFLLFRRLAKKQFATFENQKITFVFHVNFCFLTLSFWGFLILLFLICFFRYFVFFITNIQDRSAKFNI